ncbi:MAG: hypothetical protein JF565_06700 [Propionibacteriales bacterium]|jgi:hypothetical protein|nr:hypothetical protein [Propionibacteriales bacterium]
MNGVAGPVHGPLISPPAPVRRVRRVRHEVRDGLTLMAFSAATSAGLAAALMLLAGLGK